MGRKGEVELQYHIRDVNNANPDFISLQKESIISDCNLYNLQTLILSQCWKLTELPIHIGKLISLRHLDISHTHIKELPMQIVGLENLRTLTFFVVGKRQVGLSIKEIRKFTHLHGKFTILNLHNIVDTMEAYEADLKSKEHIEELVLQWGKQPEDSQLEKVVLDALQPSLNLKKLGIHSYGGTSFPSWLGDSMFSNMVFLHIENCKYCVTLPPLGQLVSLKDLLVGGMTILETIGSEFYGMEGGGSNSLFQPFSSLQKLTFLNMPNWKEWLPFEGNMLPFPRLITLRLLECPELRGHLPSHLFSIETLEVKGCGHVLATPPTMHWLSSIKEIDVVGDSQFEGATERTQWSLLGSDSPCQLQSLRITWCDALLPLPKMILSSTCLQHLKLYGIPSLTAFPDIGLPTSLCSLEIVKCKNLAFLPPETWSNYKSLVNLELQNSCHALTAFPLDGFPALKKLDISQCDSLESIFISESCSSIRRPSTLQSLTVIFCNALRSLPQQMNTFTALERLYIDFCNALRSLPQRMDTLTALEGLSLHNLPELELSFSEGTFLPSKLRYLRIRSVGRTTTPVTKWGLQRLTALLGLGIGGNDDIVKTLLKEPLLPVSLLNLTIYDLDETKSLEGNGLRHLSSLKSLNFSRCSVLESFSEDMLPSSLVELLFWDCARLESLPEDTLPSSLKLLRIWKCPLLEARYGSQSGEHWSKISHIPFIEIND